MTTDVCSKHGPYHTICRECDAEYMESTQHPVTYTTNTPRPTDPLDLEKLMGSIADVQLDRAKIPALMEVSADVGRAIKDVVESNTHIATAKPPAFISLFGLPFKVDEDLPPETIKVKNAAGEVIGTIKNIQ